LRGSSLSVWLVSYNGGCRGCRNHTNTSNSPPRPEPYPHGSQARKHPLTGRLIPDFHLQSPYTLLPIQHLPYSSTTSCPPGPRNQVDRLWFRNFPRRVPLVCCQHTPLSSTGDHPRARVVIPLRYMEHRLHPGRILHWRRPVPDAR
jgi:hypothetical protein